MGCGDLPAMGEDSGDWLTTMEAPGYTRHPHSFQYFVVNSFSSTINILQCFLHFCTFQRLSAGKCTTTCIGFQCPFIAFIVFSWGVGAEHFVAFTAFVLFIECLGWTFVAFTAVCSIYEAFGLVVLWHLECLQHLWGIGVGPLWRLQRYQCLLGIRVGRLWCFTALVAFMGHWCGMFGTWFLFSLCMFLHAQRGWVPPGLAYRGSGFSQL